MADDFKKVDIDKKGCKGCQLCVDVCPVNIIKMSADINALGYHFAEVTDQGKCVSCGRCATICPDIVIEVYKKVSK